MIVGLRGTGLSALVRFSPAVGVACALALPAASALGQAAPALTVPPPLMAANPDRAFPGLWESLEAGAVLARDGDPAAVWYNPAGIVLTDRSVLAANAPGYEFTTFGGSGIDKPVSGSSLRGVPSFVGFILGREVIPWRNWRVGFGMTNPLSWKQSLTVNSEPSPGQRSTYTVNSEIENFQGSWALAWAPMPDLRIGASIGFAWDSVSNVSQIVSESTTSTTWQGSTSSVSSNGSTQQFVSALGAQYDIMPWLRIGAVVRAPSVRIWGASSITYDALANTTDSQQLHFNDGAARFEFRQPLQVAAGTSARLGPVNLELDLSWHAASGSYTFYSSSNPVRVVTAPGPNGQPVVTNTAFPDVRTATRAVVNSSIGGNLRVGKLWTLHLGTYFNQSPTLVADPYFQPIDFWGVRTGASLKTRTIAGSVGFGYEVGGSGRAIGLGSLPGVAPPGTQGNLTIHTFSILLALGYTF